MTRIAFLRHGKTAWNAEGRLTGRADIPLSPEGRSTIAKRRLPDDFRAAAWHISPLRRARETAELLGSPGGETEPRLVEMDFGSYEGRRLEELRESLGAEMRENEDRGLDFQPPGGESPRAVQQRLRPFLSDVAAQGGLHVAVCHKSIIRCVLALAFDWPMLGRPPARLKWDCLHLFRLERDGRPLAEELNIPLLERRACT